MIDQGLKVEAFLNGAWVNVNTYIADKSRVTWKRGANVEDRKPRVATASFTLNNSDETWTPGNTASTYFNQLVKGTPVRISTTVSAVVHYEFTGTVVALKPSHPETGQAARSMAVSCRGKTDLMRAYQTYNMALTANRRVDLAMADMLTAAGFSGSDYSFDTSPRSIPLSFSRADVLSDAIAAAAADTGIAYEDGQGRLRLKSITNLLGGRGAPTHTWGTTIAPEGDLTPDYRNDAQFARLTANVAVLTTSEEFGDIYKHSPNADNPAGLDLIPAGATYRLRGRFTEMPISVAPTLVANTGGGGFPNSTAVLETAINATTTTVRISNPTMDAAYGVGRPIMGAGGYVAPGMRFRMDNELMLCTAVDTQRLNFGQADQFTPTILRFVDILTVERAVEGTVAASHAVSAAVRPDLAYRLPAKEDRKAFALPNAWGVSTALPPPNSWAYIITSGATSLRVKEGTIAQAFNETTQTWGEKIQFVLYGDSGYYVNRGAQETTVTAHPAGTVFYVETYDYTFSDDENHIVHASDLAAGKPAGPYDVVGANTFSGGATIVYSGKDFVLDIRNGAAAARYLARVILRGKYVDIKSGTAPTSLELAIPYIPGVPDGGSIDFPLGIDDANIARGNLVARLMSGRVPSPWLNPTFTLNVDANASLRTAEIGDLVRYTGTGSNSERIDDWFRIVGIDGSSTPGGFVNLTFLLAPADLWRNPAQSFFTTFARQDLASDDSLGDFIIAPTGAAGWTLDTSYDNKRTAGSTPALSPTYANALGVAAPGPALHLLGAATQYVAAAFDFGTLSANTFTSAALGGGVGLVFRSNSTGSTKWLVMANPNLGTIYLWNSSVGAVAGASVAYTFANNQVLELAVRAEDNRIRVYADAKGEPIIDIVNTYQNTGTYAGLEIRRTINSGGGDYPRFRWYSAQGG